MASKKICMYKNCSNKSRTKLIYSCPSKYLIQRLYWIDNSGNSHQKDQLLDKDYKCITICEDHFQESDFHKYKYEWKLKSKAVPRHYQDDVGMEKKVTPQTNPTENVMEVQADNESSDKVSLSIKNLNLIPENHKLPIVYTTKLDDMNILRCKLGLKKHSEIIESIIAESRPVFKNLKQNNDNSAKKIKRKTGFFCMLIINNKLNTINRKALLENVNTARKTEHEELRKKPSTSLVCDDPKLLLTSECDIKFEPFIDLNVSSELTPDASSFKSTRFNIKTEMTDMYAGSSLSVSEDKNSLSKPCVEVKHYIVESNKFQNINTFRDNLEDFPMQCEFVLVIKVKFVLHVYNVAMNRIILSVKRYQLKRHAAGFKLKIPHYGKFMKLVELCCWFKRESFLNEFGPNFFANVHFLREPHKCLLDFCICCCCVRPNNTNEELTCNPEKNNAPDQSSLWFDKMSKKSKVSNTGNIISKALNFSKNLVLNAPIQNTSGTDEILHDSTTDKKISSFTLLNSDFLEYYEKRSNGELTCALKTKHEGLKSRKRSININYLNKTDGLCKRKKILSDVGLNFKYHDFFHNYTSTSCEPCNDISKKTNYTEQARNNEIEINSSDDATIVISEPITETNSQGPSPLATDVRSLLTRDTNLNFPSTLVTIINAISCSPTNIPRVSTRAKKLNDPPALATNLNVISSFPKNMNGFSTSAKIISDPPTLATNLNGISSFPKSMNGFSTCAKIINGPPALAKNLNGISSLPTNKVDFPGTDDARILISQPMIDTDLRDPLTLDTNLPCPSTLVTNLNGISSIPTNINGFSTLAKNPNNPSNKIEVLNMYVNDKGKINVVLNTPLKKLTPLGLKALGKVISNAQQRVNNMAPMTTLNHESFKQNVPVIISLPNPAGQDLPSAAMYVPVPKLVMLPQPCVRPQMNEPVQNIKQEIPVAAVTPVRTVKPSILRIRPKRKVAISERPPKFNIPRVFNSK